MGTNYYVEPIKKNVFTDKLHIGKSSFGWVFMLRVYPEKDIDDLKDWIRILENEECVIRDEYGTEVSIDELLSVITERRTSGLDHVRRQDPNFLRENSAIYDPPSGLLRCFPYAFGSGFVRHGAGSWDCLSNEFS